MRHLAASAAALVCFVLYAPVAAGASPLNDDFASAQQLSGSLPIEVTGTTIGATQQGGDPSQGDDHSAGHTVWFSWEASSTEDVTIGTCGSEIATILGVYTGDDLGALTEVASSRHSFGPNCAYAGSEVTFRATSGETYSIEVDGNAFQYQAPPLSGEGAIELQIQSQAPPANDDFADSETLVGMSVSTPAGNWGATKESGEPDHRGNKGGASVWFSWTAPRTEGASVQACGGPVGIESMVAVYTGNAVNALNPVSPIESWSDCHVAFMAFAGVTYRIAVDGEYNPAIGTANMEAPGLSIAMFPGNDDFQNAWDLGDTKGVMVIGMGSIGATKQPAEPDHAGNRGGASVWFNWTAPQSGSLQVGVCNLDFPGLLAVYTGPSLNNLSPVAASSNINDLGCAGFGEGEEGGIGFNVDAGTTYRIAIDGHDGAWGKFILALSASSKRLETPGLPPEDAAKARRPQTRIVKRHVNRRRGIAIFSLGSSHVGSRFLCKLDSHRFRACGSTVVYRNLKSGSHTFRAKAVDGAGPSDATPVVIHFGIHRRR